MLFGILLTAQVLICAAMGGLILIQQSEGGALGMGGGPSGFMSARGAGNLLTKTTWVFAALLFANSLGMTVVGNMESRGASAIDQVDTSKLAAPTLPQVSTSAASSSTASAPSLNDLPVASAPTLTPLPQSSSALPGTASSVAPQTSTAPLRMPKPLAQTPTAPVSTAPTHMPAPLNPATLPTTHAAHSSSASLPAALPSASPSASGSGSATSLPQ